MFNYANFVDALIFKMIKLPGKEAIDLADETKMEKLAECEWTIVEVLKGKDVTMKKKTFIKDLIVLFIAVAALICAALNLHVSLNMLGTKEEE